MSDSASSRLLQNPEMTRRVSMQSLFESLDALCEGTVIVDRDARIVWINERYATRLWGKPAAEAIGKAVEDVIPNTLMRSVVTSGQPILLDIMETPSATFVVSRIPLKDDRGEVIGAAGFAFFDNVQSLKPLFAKWEEMQQEISAAQKSLAIQRRPKYTFSNFIGSSPICMVVKRQARRAAPCPTWCAGPQAGIRCHAGSSRRPAGHGSARARHGHRGRDLAPPPRP